MSDAPVTLNPPSRPASRTGAAGRRLAWLDALRGFAALFVVFDHLSYDVLQHARADVEQYFDPGLYGVFVFFMVSGYIVPASLERKGSVRGFWVSRLFRLYPLYLLGLVVAVCLWKAGVALAVTRYRLPKRAGAILAGGTALLLVCVNGNWVHPFEALTILALMFTGTMLYRAERGDYPWRRAVPAAVVVFVLATVAGLWGVSSWNLWSALAHQVTYRQWVTSLLGAGLTFAAGLACRHQKVPAALAWLGLVSFSVYLLHPLLIEVYKRIPFTRNPHPFPEQVLLAGAFLIVLLGCCWLSHRFVESSMQRQGRRFAAWLDAWFGPDTLQAVPAGSAPSLDAAWEEPARAQAARQQQAAREEPARDHAAPAESALHIGHP